MWTEHLTTNLVKEKTQGVNLKALGACCKAAIRAADALPAGPHNMVISTVKVTPGVGSCKSTLNTYRRACMNTLGVCNYQKM